MAISEPTQKKYKDDTQRGDRTAGDALTTKRGDGGGALGAGFGDGDFCGCGSEAIEKQLGRLHGAGSGGRKTGASEGNRSGETQTRAWADQEGGRARRGLQRRSRSQD